VTPSLRKVADSFARKGYLVAVPDIIWRIEKGLSLEYSGSDHKKALDCLAKFDWDQGVNDVMAAVDAVRSLPECNGRVVAVGYCLGGSLAYLAACRHRMDGAIAYYSIEILEHLDEGKNLSCPVLMHFAENDHLLKPEAVQQIRDGLKGCPATIHNYPNVGHAFCRDVDPKDTTSAEQAFKANERTFEYLNSFSSR
jgi:carboxymethylenebutenolidase